MKTHTIEIHLGETPVTIEQSGRYAHLLFRQCGNHASPTHRSVHGALSHFHDEVVSIECPTADGMTMIRIPENIDWVLEKLSQTYSETRMPVRLSGG